MKSNLMPPWRKQTTRLTRIKSNKKLIKYLLVGLVAIFSIIIFALFVKFLTFYNSIHTEVSATSQTVKQEEKTEYTFLLLGYGGGKHEGTYLTDTIMVANINLKTKKVLLLSIPRDVWVKVPTIESPFYSKINAVYQMGLFPKNYPDVDRSLLSEDNASGLLKKVVTDITGLNIDAFAAIDFQGFVKVVDNLGGLEINVKKSFTDYEYPIEDKEDDLCGRDEEFAQIEPVINKTISEEDKQRLFEEKPDLAKFYDDIIYHPQVAFPCRFEDLTFEKGVQQMDGETALKYARSRHSAEDGGDFNRAQRQQNVINALSSKVINIGFIPKIPSLLDELEKHIVTDLPLVDLNKFLLEARNYNQYKLEMLVLDDKFMTDGYADYGGYIVYPKEGIGKWNTIRKTIYDMKNSISPTPKILSPTPINMAK